MGFPGDMFPETDMCGPEKKYNETSFNRLIDLKQGNWSHYTRELGLDLVHTGEGIRGTCGETAIVKWT
ncbi:MAG: hypothetical protein DRH08_04555 [Deltaproteobacteria bacterium]|nr:MAG: hypothetical protein DRH08_04555 [Deltaproteobacteria bacterium]